MRELYFFILFSAAAVFTAALLCVRAADAGFAAFFCLYKVGNDAADNKGDHKNNDDVFHSLLIQCVLSLEALVALDDS